MEKVADGKAWRRTGAIRPYIPHEEGEDGGGEVAQERLEVERLAVVERHSHTYGVQRRCVALHVLDGVGVGVEYVGIVENRLRRTAGALLQVVIVGIDTRYHVAPHPTGSNQTHNGSLLATFEMVESRGQHHLEVALGVLETREHRPPEEYVVVALDISHDATASLTRAEPIGRLYILRRYSVAQSFCHNPSFEF